MTAFRLHWPIGSPLVSDEIIASIWLAPVVEISKNRIGITTQNAKLV